MIEILIDYNNDEVVINDGSTHEAKIKVKQPKEIESVLIELLNSLHNSESIVLTKVDEDTKVTIDEW